jgi:hypothetical protein
MRIRKWLVACHLKFTFCIYIQISFQKTLVKSVTSNMNTFVKILSQWNTAIKFSGRLYEASLLLDVVP